MLFVHDIAVAYRFDVDEQKGWRVPYGLSSRHDYSKETQLARKGVCKKDKSLEDASLIDFYGLLPPSLVRRTQVAGGPVGMGSTARTGA